MILDVFDNKLKKKIIKFFFCYNKLAGSDRRKMSEALRHIVLSCFKGSSSDGKNSNLTLIGLAWLSV